MEIALAAAIGVIGTVLGVVISQWLELKRDRERMAHEDQMEALKIAIDDRSNCDQAVASLLAHADLDPEGAAMKDGELAAVAITLSALLQRRTDEERALFGRRILALKDLPPEDRRRAWRDLQVDLAWARVQCLVSSGRPALGPVRRLEEE